MLSSQVAVITGAGRGIGAATARLFARHGAAVVVNDLDAAEADAVVRDIVDSGGRATSFAGDVTARSFPTQVMEHTLSHHGKLNHLINNAGFCWDSVMHKMTDEAFDRVLECHARAPFRLIREAAPLLREAAKADRAAGRPLEARSVVNVTSTSGLHGNVGQANYSLAKAGIIGLTKTLAREWGPFGVRANCVAFGFINTRLTGLAGEGGSVRVGERRIPQGLPDAARSAWEDGGLLQQLPLARAGSVEEAAGGVLFLASPFASYVTGHVLEVTGGLGI